MDQRSLTTLHVTHTHTHSSKRKLYDNNVVGDILTMVKALRQLVNITLLVELLVMQFTIDLIG